MIYYAYFQVHTCIWVLTRTCLHASMLKKLLYFSHAGCAAVPLSTLCLKCSV